MEQDIRVERTKSSLRKAFKELLKNTPAHAISVTNLTKKAGVSRVTFYIHYKDISDFITKNCDWTVENMVWEAAGEMNLFNLDNARLIFTKQIEYVMEHKELFQALLSSNGPSYFWDKMIATIENEYHRAFERVKDKFEDQQQIDDLIKYISAGELALLLYWIHSDKNETVEEMVDRLMDLTFKGALVGLEIMEI